MPWQSCAAERLATAMGDAVSIPVAVVVQGLHTALGPLAQAVAVRAVDEQVAVVVAVVVADLHHHDLGGLTTGQQQRLAAGGEDGPTDGGAEELP